MVGLGSIGGLGWWSQGGDGSPEMVEVSDWWLGVVAIMS